MTLEEICAIPAGQLVRQYTKTELIGFYYALYTFKPKSTATKHDIARALNKHHQGMQNAKKNYGWL